MKRYLAIILSILLFLSCPAFAENASAAQDPATGSAGGNSALSSLMSELSEKIDLLEDITEATEEPEAAFADLLPAWAENLNPAVNDLNAVLSVGDSSYAASLRQSDSVMEIAIDGLGTLQFDQNRFVLNALGQTYVLETQTLLNVLAEVQRVQYQQAEDVELIRRFLMRAVQELLLPSVSFSSGYDGVNLHIELSDAELGERLFAFIDETIGSEDFERLFNHYSQYLRSMIPDIPTSVEALREAWSSVGPYRPSMLYAFSLDADAHMSYHAWSGLEIACAGHFSNRISQTSFSFELTPCDEGFSLASVLSGFNRMMGGFYDIAASLDVQGPHLYGNLLINSGESFSYVLDASLTDYGFDAELTGHQGNRLTGRLTADGWYDTDEDRLRGEVCYTNGDDEDAVTETIASVDAKFWDGGCSGTLYIPDNSIHFRTVEGSGHSHVMLRTQPQSGYTASDSVDFWLFNLDDEGYRVQCEFSQELRGRRVRQTRLTGAIGPTGITFDYSDPMTGKSASGSLSYAQGPDSFDYGVDFVNNATLFRQRYYMEKTPFSLHFTRSDGEYGITFTDTLLPGYVASYPMIVSFDGRLALDDDGRIVRIDSTFDAAAPVMASDALRSVRFSWIPGKAILGIDNQVITLEKVSESGREICYRLSTDNNAMDYTLVIGLDEALRVLTARVSAGGHDIASLTIAALDKTAIAPLDTEGAVQLDMAFLMNLIAEAQRSGQASYAASTTAERPAEAARAEEAVEEAIEEAAAEAAEEAVEEAAPESPIGG